MQAGVLAFEAACDTIQQYREKLKPRASEPVAIEHVLNRVLAEPVLADRDFPPFPRATRDGYSVKVADLGSIPVSLRIVGQIKAGSNYQRTLQAGEAVEIMTGAPVPTGADAVVMVEYTKTNGKQVEILRGVIAGENIVPKGSEGKAGQEMLSPGARFGFVEIAAAAAAGKSTLTCYQKPRVAILATGDEIVDISTKPGPHQIRNSNSYSLAAQVMLAGGEPVPLPIAPDDKMALMGLIQQGLSADLLLLSGGVSMGQFDLVEEVLNTLGAKFFFTGAQIQPGKPVVFGEAPFIRGHRNAALRRPREGVRARQRFSSLTSSGKNAASTPFFGLPGNPVSTMVTFDLFVRPVLDALSGGNPTRLPTAKARLSKAVKTKTGLTRFLPAVVRGGLYDPEVELVPWQGSGDILAAARANCYIVIPPDRDSIALGEMVSILLRS